MATTSLAALLPTDPLSLLLVVAVVVLCVTTVAMIVSAGATERNRRNRPVARLGAIPVVPMISPPRAAQRSVAVEARLGEPIVEPAARQAPAAGDGLSGHAARVDQAHAIADHLAETDPRRLAEIITQWMHQDDPST